MKKNILFIIILVIPFILRAQSSDTTNKKIIVKTSPIISPVFPGGMRGWTHFLNTYIRYPANAQTNKVQGKVLLQFVVEENGSLSNITVISSPSIDLSNESLRVMRYSPRWKPATQDGKPIRVKFKAPINFTLTAAPVQN